MKYLFIILFLCVELVSIWAQPANNSCSSATQLTNLNNACVTGTTTGATFDAYVFTCMGGDNNVWYRFVAQGTEATITVTGGNGSRPEMGISRANGNGCSTATATGISCTTNSGNWSSISTTVSSLVVGEEYYIQIANGGNTTGSFQLCINNPIPAPPTGNNQDCVDALLICTTSPFSGNSNGEGIEELNSSNAGCLGSFENNTSWVYFTAATSGTLTFTLTPQAADDYDFAVWGPNSTCPPSTPPLRCSWAQYPQTGNGASACGTNNTTTGLVLNLAETSETACSDGLVRHLDVLAGETYILLVDGYTPSPDPFTISFGGTATLDCTVLAVQLQDFKGKTKAQTHELSWATAQEANSSHFVLERSFDAEHWEDVQTVSAQGYVEKESQYEVAVPIKNDHVHYYRLRIVDGQGAYDYSRIVALQGELSQNQLSLHKVYPQPATQGQVQVAWFADEGQEIQLSILSLQGQVLHQVQYTQAGIYQEQSLNLQHLPAGLYLLDLFDVKNGQRQQRKLVLN